jgi:hypothetical protein
MPSAAVAALAVIVMLLSTLSFMGIHAVSADSYKKTQSASSSSQINQCGNYWFPINILCSNINSETQGDENSVEVTSAQEDRNVESTKNLGAPFP